MGPQVRPLPVWAIGLVLGVGFLLMVYGATGSLVILLLWIYYSAQIFLLGAEFTRVVTYEYGSRRSSARICAFLHGTSRRAAPVGFLNPAPDLTHTNTKGLANALPARIGPDWTVAQWPQGRFDSGRPSD
jgi:hypothetical protein